MKFLRIFGLFVFAATLAYADPLADEQAKRAQEEVPAANRSGDAAATEETPAEQSAETPSEAQPEETAETPAEETHEETAAAEETPADGASHVVVKGDTLWDIADTSYHNPFDWQKIWNANKDQIENPDLIYPDQKFMIPDGSAAPMARAPKAKKSAAPRQEEESAEEPAAAEEEAEPAEVKAPAAEEKTETASAPEEEEPEEPTPEELVPPAPVKKVTGKARDAYKTGTFLTDKEWEGSGRIVGDQDHKLLLAQGDIVYLNIGAANGVKSKMRGTIYRRGRKVRDPETGDSLGYSINRLGGIEITQEVTDNTATAVIMTSENPIRIGDFVSLDE
jgi:LysM repeat protein